MTPEFVLDGRRITSLETFFDEIGQLLIPGANWGGNYNAFNDILYGGFGTPEEAFILRWNHSELSRQRLAGPAWPDATQSIFEVLIEIITYHRPTAANPHGVSLVLA